MGRGQNWMGTAAFVPWISMNGINQFITIQYNSSIAYVSWPIETMVCGTYGQAFHAFATVERLIIVSEAAGTSSSLLHKSLTATSGHKNVNAKLIPFAWTGELFSESRSHFQKSRRKHTYVCDRMCENHWKSILQSTNFCSWLDRWLLQIKLNKITSMELQNQVLMIPTSRTFGTGAWNRLRVQDTLRPSENCKNFASKPLCTDCWSASLRLVWWTPPDVQEFKRTCVNLLGKQIL